MQDVRIRDALAKVREAFAGEPRPEHLTNYKHCEECAEHDQTLRGCTPDSIGEAEVGNPGWDPICFITDPGFQYYIRGLARLVVETNSGYLDQFLFHLTHRGPVVFTPAQREAVRAFLVAIEDAGRISLDDSPTAWLMFEAIDRFESPDRS